MSRNNHRSRRQFLQQSLAGLTTLSAATGAFGSRRAHAAIGGLQRRRHLINIMTSGGVDSLWWQNGVHSSEYFPLSRTDGGAIVQGTPGSLGFVNPTDILAPFNNNNCSLRPKVTWDLRFPDSFLSAHPFQADRLLGPGMSGFTADDLQSTLIWRGISPEGGHFLGNRIIQTGTTGDQTPSFPSVIAQLLSLDYVRPLHYAQLARDPSAMCNQSGSLTGPALPVNIPDLEAWASVTNNKDGLSTDRRTLLNDTIRALTQQMGASSLKLPRSKGLFASFMDFFNGAVTVGGSNYATSLEFTALVSKYADEMTTALGTHAFKGWFPSSTLFEMNISRKSTAQETEFFDLASRFALAEFLVVHDLAAVVDLPTLHTDFHQRVDDECGTMLAIYTGYRVLVRSLRQTEWPAGSGKSLLDITTVVMHTEFDRDPLLSGDNLMLNRSGTGHFDRGGSLLMAGMGVRGGTVVGDFKRSAAGRYTDADYPATAFIPFSALPIDPRTGLPSPTGRVVTMRAVYPTLLSVFGAGGFAAINGGEAPLPAIFAA